MNNTPDSTAQTPDDRMDQGGNYWTLFTPGIRKVLHAVSQVTSHAAMQTFINEAFGAGLLDRAVSVEECFVSQHVPCRRPRFRFDDFRSILPRVTCAMLVISRLAAR